MNNENVIEIINNDYVVSIDNPEYKLEVNNLIVMDYTYCNNKPKINSIELTGNKTSQELNLISQTDIENMEDISNKVISVDEQSTDIEYPSAKCVYTCLEDKADLNDVYTKNETDIFLEAKSDKATTLSGYGITDAYTKSVIDSRVHIIDTYQQDTSGYIIWSNGYCEQWGLTASIASNQRTDVTFLKKLNSTTGNRVRLLRGQNTYGNYTPSYNSLTVDGMEIWNNDTASNASTIQWEICGYIAEGEY